MVKIVRILLTGGGTGGHIYPALSMIKAIKKAHPEAVFLYIGTPDGLEAKIVPSFEIEFKPIKASGIKRSLSVKNLKTLYDFIKSIAVAKKYLQAFNPDIVIGTGGYVCAPVVYAAAKLKIKTVIHEQNSLPGITNKFLAAYADKVLICFEETRKYFAANKVVLTGNPRASEVVATLKVGKCALGLNQHKKTVLISGGSRGARPINDAFLAKLHAYEAANFEVVFVTGEVHYESICEQIGKVDQLKNIKVVPFIADMPKFLVSIDLFVGRAGATFLAEITALGVASILIPSPYVAENHQEFNARSITDHGGATLILEAALTGEALHDEIVRLLNDDVALSAMRSATKKLGIVDASTRILEVLNDLI